MSLGCFLQFHNTFPETLHEAVIFHGKSVILVYCLTRYLHSLGYLAKLLDKLVVVVVEQPQLVQIGAQVNIEPASPGVGFNSVDKAVAPGIENPL